MDLGIARGAESHGRPGEEIAGAQGRPAKQRYVDVVVTPGGVVEHIVIHELELRASLGVPDLQENRPRIAEGIAEQRGRVRAELGRHSPQPGELGSDPHGAHGHPTPHAQSQLSAKWAPSRREDRCQDQGRSANSHLAPLLSRVRSQRIRMLRPLPLGNRGDPRGAERGDLIDRPERSDRQSVKDCGPRFFKTRTEGGGWVCRAGCWNGNPECGRDLTIRFRVRENGPCHPGGNLLSSCGLYRWS